MISFSKSRFEPCGVMLEYFIDLVTVAKIKEALTICLIGDIIRYCLKKIKKNGFKWIIRFRFVDIGMKVE